MREHTLLSATTITCTILIAAAISAAGASDDTTVLFSTCSDLKFSPTSSPYQLNLNSLLSSLSTAASYSLYSNFTTSIASSEFPVSGLYQCNADLSFPDCGSCVKSAIRQLSPLCPYSAAATVRLRRCLLRYGNDSFLGQSDDTLQYKRCGPGMTAGAYSDPTPMEAVNDVLTSIAQGKGSYRVVHAVNIDGVGQCVGDQDVDHCNDCLEAATADLKSLCAGTFSGEVYLAKCQASYSVRGFRSDTNPDRNGEHHDSGDGKSSDNNGKNLAIIIGVVAAVILVILFLNYLRKSSEEKGKA